MQRLKQLLRIGLVNDKGDTIVEVIIVTAILGLVLVASYATNHQALQNGVEANQRSEALSIAKQQTEYIKDVYLHNSGQLATSLQPPYNFCIVNQGGATTVPHASDPDCAKYNTQGSSSNNPYAVSDSFDTSSSVYHISVTWPSSSSVQNNVDLYYKVAVGGGGGPTATLTVHKTGPTADAGEVISDDGGIDCGDSCSNEYAVDSSVRLNESIDPAAGIFGGWKDAAGNSLAECPGTPISCTVVVPAGGKDVYADFQNVPPPPQILTVKVVPADKGNKVNSDDGGISNCTNSCTHSYPKGTTITLTATADPGYDYGNWSGGGCSGSDSSPCTVSMDAAKTVTADFTPKSSTPNGVRTLGTCNSPPYWGGFQACAEANPNGNQTFGWFDWKLNYGDLDASSTPSCYPVDLGNGTTTVGIAPYAGIGAACDGSCKYNPGWGYPGCPGPGTPIYYRFHVCYRPYCPSSIDSQSNQTDPSKDIKGYTQFVSTGPGVDVKQDACEIWNDSNDGSKVHLQSMTCHHDGQADTWPQEIRYRFYTCTPDGSGWYTSGSTGKVTNPNGNTGVDIPILAGSFHDLQLEAWSAGMSGTNWVDSAFNHCP